MPVAVVAVATALGTALPASASRALAQPAAQPAAYPAELVLPLLASLGAGSPARVVVGEVPAAFPHDAVPPAPARVVGGTSGRYASTLVVALPADAGRSARDESPAGGHVERTLRGAGWTPAPRRDGEVFLTPRGVAVPTVYCRGSQVLFLSDAPGPGPERYVLLSAPSQEPSMPCGDRDRRGAPELPLAVPELAPPRAAMEVRGMGSGGSDDEITVSFTFRGDMPAADLLAHYAAQLETGGWQLRETLAAGPAVARVAEARDRRGRRWRGVLLVLGVAGLRDVSIHMVRDDVRTTAPGGGAR